MESQIFYYCLYVIATCVFQKLLHLLGIDKETVIDILAIWHLPLLDQCGQSLQTVFLHIYAALKSGFLNYCVYTILISRVMYISVSVNSDVFHSCHQSNRLDLVILADPLATLFVLCSNLHNSHQFLIRQIVGLSGSRECVSVSLPSC